MRAECAQAAAGLRLARTGRASGARGHRTGDRPGAGLEFFDQREYQLGDDLRRIDWRGVARTDRWMVRRFAAETSPFLDLVVDTSGSMAVTPTKRRATLDLVDAIVAWATLETGAAGSVRVWSDRGDSIALDDGFAAGWPSDAPAAGAASGASGHSSDLAGAREKVRARSRRVLISDFLVDTDPAPAIAGLVLGATALDVIQVLDPTECEPTRLLPEPAHAHRADLELVDCENGAAIHVRLDEATCTGYRNRLRALCEGVRAAASGAGARYARLEADEPAPMFATLLAAGMVEPA